MKPASRVISVQRAVTPKFPVRRELIILCLAASTEAPVLHVILETAVRAPVNHLNNSAQPVISVPPMNQEFPIAESIPVQPGPTMSLQSLLRDYLQKPSVLHAQKENGVRKDQQLSLTVLLGIFVAQDSVRNQETIIPMSKLRISADVFRYF